MASPPNVRGKAEVTGMLENLSGETRLFPIIGDPIIFVKIPPRLTGDLQARGRNGICVPGDRSHKGIQHLAESVRGLGREEVSAIVHMFLFHSD